MALKLLKSVVSATIASAAIVGSVISASAYGLEGHAQKEIRNMYEKMYFDLHSTTQYDEDYSGVSPMKTGELSADTLEEGLNSINFCRYLAGLPYDVELKQEYNTLAQHSSLIIYINDALSHEPEQPKGMSDSMYKLAFQGSEESNIGIGYLNIQSAVISGYMSDTDTTNLKMMGHRRWILNPKMKYTGLGMVNSSTAMYVRDKSREEEFDGDYIYWPPAQMPYELIGTSKYGYAFTVTLNEDKYEVPDRNKVKVTMTSQKLGKTWTFDKDSRGTYETDADMVGYFSVNTQRTGIGNCIIFNPGPLPEDDAIDVKITGIYKKGGEQTSISYKVNFFNLLDDDDYTIKFDSSKYDVEVGKTLQIKGYNNPLRNAPADMSKYNFTILNSGSDAGNLTIWFDKDEKVVKDHIDFTMAGGTINLKAKKEGQLVFYVGHSLGYLKTAKTTINITHAHTRSSSWVTEAPTALEAGYRYHVCTVCGERIDGEVLPATSLNAASVNIVISDSKVEYSKNIGTPVPTIKIYSSGQRLTEGVDYTLSYVTPEKTGIAIVTITGKGYYSGSRSISYTIVDRAKVSLNSLSISFPDKSSYTYKGEDITPKLTIKEGSYTLKANEDYSVVYANNLNVGTAVVTVKGLGEYSGEKNFTFSITAADIGSPWVVDDLGEVKYTGKPITISFELKSQVTGEKMVENVDYTVSYANNTNVGTATITVTGKGNYKGTTTKTFKIVSAGGSTGSGQGGSTVTTQKTTIVLGEEANSENTEIRFVAKDGKVYKLTSSSGSAFSADIPAGDYKAWIVKKKCAPLSMDVTVGNAPVSLDAKLYAYGDANCDGKIDASDITTLISYIKGAQQPENEYQFKVADVAVNGKFDATDITVIISLMKGAEYDEFNVDIDTLIKEQS